MTDPIYLQLCALIALLCAMILWLMFLRGRRTACDFREEARNSIYDLRAEAKTTEEASRRLRDELAEVNSLARHFHHQMRIWRTKARIAESLLFLARAEQSEAGHDTPSNSHPK